jgi:type VI secretion system secreted protein Hcp
MGSRQNTVLFTTLALAGLTLFGLRERAVAAVPPAPAGDTIAVGPSVPGDAVSSIVLDSSLVGLDGQIFLEMPGIPGESPHPGATGLMDVLSWSWGATNTGAHGAGGGGGAGKVNVHDISITKYVDKATPLLMQACATGKHIPRAVITMRKAGGREQEYLTFELKNVQITSFQMGGTGAEDRPTETLSLNFEEIKVVYRELKEDGSTQPHQMTWDVKRNKAQ